MISLPRGAFGRFMFPAVLSVLLGGCATASQPYAVALPDGFYIQRDRSSQADIVRRGGSRIVDGPIAAYAVHQRFVVGAVGEWPHRSSGYPNEAAFPGSPDAQYFILDTATGYVESGLKIDAWKKALSAHGIPQDIRIRAPLLL